MQRHFKNRSALLGAHYLQSHALKPIAVDGHRCAQPRYLLRCCGAADGDAVELRQAVARMGQMVEQLTVVCHEQKSLRVAVESADRIQPYAIALYKLRDGFSAQLIRECCDISARLVQHDGKIFLDRLDPYAVYLDVSPRHDIAAETCRLAVYADSALCDSLLRRAAAHHSAG